MLRKAQQVEAQEKVKLRLDPLNAGLHMHEEESIPI